MVDSIDISIAYSNESGGQWFDWQAPAGFSLRRILTHPTVIKKVGLIDFEQTKLGVWGKKVPANTIAKQGDRIEIYQPLQIDPKEARKIRVVNNKESKATQK